MCYSWIAFHNEIVFLQDYFSCNGYPSQLVKRTFFFSVYYFVGVFFKYLYILFTELKPAPTALHYLPHHLLPLNTSHLALNQRPQPYTTSGSIRPCIKTPTTGTFTLPPTPSPPPDLYPLQQAPLHNLPHHHPALDHLNGVTQIPTPHLPPQHKL